MVCIHCGSPIFEGDKFCSKCGTRVAEVTTTGTEAAEAASEPEKVEETEPAPDAIPLCIPEEKASKAGSRLNGLFRGKRAPFKSGRPVKWVPRVILCLLGVVAVILTANSGRLINSCHRNFSTPEEYYRWAEQKAIHENAKTLARYYANYFMDYLHRFDSHISSEIRLEIGDACRDMMESAGLEPWFEEGVFTFESNNKNGVTQSLLGLEIGGEKLFGMDAIMDLGDEAAYLGFPGITGVYYGVDTGEKGFAEGFEYASGMKPEEYLEYLELLEVLYEECPDRKQMEALADRYLNLLLNSIDDVKMRTGKTVRAGSITQTCTTLEIYLDKNEIQNMMTEFLEELREDSEIELLLFQIYDLVEEQELEVADYRDAEEFYEAFQDKIDEIIDDMDYYITYHDELEMTVYVDDRGQIIGRTMEFPNSWNEISFSCVWPHRGSKFGYKGSIISSGEELLVTGSGRDFGNKINGSFTVKYNGNGIVDIAVDNFDMNSLKKGYVNGSFTVTAASGIGRAMDMSSAYSCLPDMKLIIDVSMSRSSEKLGMELKAGKELWGSLTIISKSDSGKKITVPSTRSTVFVDSDRDFEEWWDTLQWDELIKKMNRAGLPGDAIDYVEEISEMRADEVMDELSMWVWSFLYGLVYEFY